MSAPLVVTLGLDEATRQRLDEERRRHFPPGRTAVGAHVTLFHALPGELRAEVEQRLLDDSRTAAPPVQVRRLRPLGRGVAYDLSCPPVEHAHAAWQRDWREHLTRQDAQGLRLHVTVQNKVDPETARATLAQLEAGFEPWVATGTAYELWRYDGGPWTHLRRFPLGDAAG